MQNIRSRVHIGDRAPNGPPCVLLRTHIHGRKLEEVSDMAVDARMENKRKVGQGRVRYGRPE